MKIAVITGASSGMGLEFAKAIDTEETLDEIWLIARRRERLEELAKKLRTPARPDQLMPFVTRPPGSLAAFMTSPPGHMQKV